MHTEPIVVTIAALSLLLPASATAQDQDQAERQIVLNGCVMREWQYRDLYGPGRSGPRGPGLGGRNEYMLVDAREIAAGAIADTNAPCPPAPGTFPTAYELTGSREGELDAFLGRRVELTGTQKGAAVTPVGPGAIPRPAGGFDPLGHELHLFEVEVASFREPAPAQAAAPIVVITPAPAQPAPQVAVITPVPQVPAATPQPEAAAQPEPPSPAQPAEQPEPAAPAIAPEQQPSPVAQLPRSASPLPLIGLLGLLSLGAAAGVRAYRR